MNDNETIRNIIVERRTELGLSLSEMARRLNIPKSTLSRYENLKHQYPLNEIQNFSKVLGLSPEAILGLEEESDIESIYSQLEPSRKEYVYTVAKNQLEEQNKIVSIRENHFHDLAAHSPDPNKKYSAEKIDEINQRLKEAKDKHK